MPQPTDTNPFMHLSSAFESTVTVLAGRRKSPTLAAITVKPMTPGARDQFSDGFDSQQREALEVIDRYGDSPHRELGHFRRRITMREFDDGKLIDRKDMGLFTPHDPTDATTTSLYASVEKKLERETIAAIFGTAYGGQDGLTAVNLDPAMVVAINSHKFGSGAGNVGMTPSKFIEAKGLLIEGNDMSDEEMANDPISCVLTQNQISQMLAYDEVTNGDYQDELRALRDGKIPSFLGVNVVRGSSSRLLRVTGQPTQLRVPMFFKSGIEAKMGPLVAWVKERTDKKGIPYAYINRIFGVSRVDEKKVVDITALEV